MFPELSESPSARDRPVWARPSVWAKRSAPGHPEPVRCVPETALPFQRLAFPGAWFELKARLRRAGLPMASLPAAV